MGIVISIAVIAAILGITYVGVVLAGMSSFFGIVLPYIAVVVFIGGFIYRVVNWAKSPVPFRIPTTCGQEKSLPFIKANSIDNPTTKLGVVVRMALEVLLFRSLFKNTKAELTDEGNLVYQWEKWLWLFGLIFHWSFFLVVFRHMRFFMAEVPWIVAMWEKIDGVFMVDLQSVYLTGVLLLVGVTALFLRRVVLPKVRYISLLNDYFPLLLLMGIAVTGLSMRYLTHVDVTNIKALSMSLVTLQPTIPGPISYMFWAHLVLVCTLLIYFPSSKLMHAAGVFMSPTRNMVNNSRMVRHINPWNPEVEVHSYAEYEDEYRDKMIAFGLPVDKTMEEAEAEKAAAGLATGSAH